MHFSGSTPQITRTIGIEFELCGAPVRLRATLDLSLIHISDHRIGLTLRNLQDILDGNLDRVIEPLILADQEEKLKNNPIQ